MSSNLVEPDDRFREYFKKYRASKTVNTIPYDKSLSRKDATDTPLGNFNSKKVTVVGMGQVGLGCVTAILHQEYVLTVMTRSYCLATDIKICYHDVALLQRIFFSATTSAVVD